MAVKQNLSFNPVFLSLLFFVSWWTEQIDENTYVFPNEVLTLLITAYRGLQALYLSEVFELLELVFNFCEQNSHSA